MPNVTAQTNLSVSEMRVSDAVNPYPGGAKGRPTLPGDGLGCKPTINNLSVGERRQSLSMLVTASMRILLLSSFLFLMRT